MSPIQSSIAVGSSFFWSTMRFLGLSEEFGSKRTKRARDRWVGIDFAPSSNGIFPYTVQYFGNPRSYGGELVWRFGATL